ncbi:MAG TPA: beta-aspartyl-peptidase [Arenimonas sp.]|nr:beta-aspartyl-peptidase [Arenimonas sp.]
MSNPLILLRHAEVYAPEPLGLCSLLLGGGRILWMGDAKDEAPRGLPLDEVDLEGRRLVPGFVDGHVHVTGGGGEGGFASRVPALPLSRYTLGGVTTVIGLLGTDDCVRSTRELLAGLYALREQGLSAWGYCGGYHLPPVTLTGSVRSDIALVEPLIGIGEVAISDHRSSQPTFDELLRLAAEAHVAGLMSGKAGHVHLHLGDGARGLELIRRALHESELPARVWNPTHCNRRTALFDEAVALAKAGVPVDFTAFPVDDGEDAYAAEDALLRYLDAGAPPARVSISSDAGGCLPCFDGDGRMTHCDIGAPGALVKTLQALLARGLPLPSALPAFTRNVAAQLRLPHKGGIGIGFDADLVVLDEHAGIHHVIAGGRWQVRDGRALQHGPFESLS